MILSSEFHFIISQLKPNGKSIFIGFLASCTYGIIDGTLIGLVKPLMDKGFIGQNYGFIHKIPLILLGIFMVRSIVTFTAHYFISKASVEISARLRKELFHDLLHYPAALYDRKNSSEFIQKINQQALVLAESATMVINLMAREGLTIIALLIVMIYASPLFTMIYLLSVPVIIGILSYATRQSIVLQRCVYRSAEAIDHHLQEVVTGHLIVKAFLGHHVESQKFSQTIDDHQEARLNEAKITARGAACVQLIGGMVIALILFLGQSPFCKLSGGDFACLLTAILAMLRPLKQLSLVGELMQKVITSGESLLSLKTYPKEQIDSPLVQTPAVQCSAVKLEFIQVDFAYPVQDNPGALQNISFVLPPGQTIALVGPSGGGKSTLVSLVPRFYEYHGKILMNDRDIMSLSLTELRQNISLVAQETILFNDTVAANIAYGSAEMDWVEVRTAAQLAFAEDFVNDLPQGFLTKIGPGGHRLSGGERQRLALARAFYKKAPLLILDEATSALDHESEEQIQRALVSLMARSSTLVIAHRLSTIMHADCILVLDKGRIVEQGTHKELLTLQGLYAQLYAQSFREQHVSS